MKDVTDTKVNGCCDSEALEEADIAVVCQKYTTGVPDDPSWKPELPGTFWAYVETGLQQAVSTCQG